MINKNQVAQLCAYVLMLSAAFASASESHIHKSNPRKEALVKFLSCVDHESLTLAKVCGPQFESDDDSLNVMPKCMAKYILRGFVPIKLLIGNLKDNTNDPGFRLVANRLPFLTAGRFNSVQKSADRFVHLPKEGSIVVGNFKPMSEDSVAKYISSYGRVFPVLNYEENVIKQLESDHIHNSACKFMSFMRYDTLCLVDVMESDNAAVTQSVNTPHTLSTREVSEVYYLIMGDVEYRAMVKPSWFANPETLHEIRTEAGCLLQKMLNVRLRKSINNRE